MSNWLEDGDPGGSLARDQRIAANTREVIPEPGAMDGFAKGVGMHTMRAAANVARTVSMAGAAMPVLNDAMHGGTTQQDEYFQAHDDVFQSSVDYWTPKAGEVGKAGQIVGGLVEGLAPLMLGPAGVPAMLGNATVGTALDLQREGVPTGTALAVGGIAGVSNALGFKIPFLGNTLASRIASGAVGNLAVNTPATALQQQALKGTKQAEQFDPTNLEARAMDILLGAAFGGYAHLVTPVRPMKQAAIDATLALRNASQFQERSAPGIPVDQASSRAHQDAMEQAMGQMLRGEKVEIDGKITDAAFLPRPIDRDANFNAWFGDSKVLDAQGKPLVVYHGTTQDFSAFDQEQRSAKTGNPNAQLGYFFSDSPAEASRYAKDWGANGGNVMPVYLAIRNPYAMPYKEFNDLAMAPWNAMMADPAYNPDSTVKFGDVEGQRAAAKRVAGYEQVAREQVAKRRDELIAEGYDGVMAKVGGVREYIAFRPEQIKSSIGNSGRFDANSSSLTDLIPKPDIMPTLKTEAAMKVASVLTPAEQAHSDAYERSAANLRELSDAVAKEKNPATKALLQTELVKQTELAAKFGSEQPMALAGPEVVASAAPKPGTKPFDINALTTEAAGLLSGGRKASDVVASMAEQGLPVSPELHNTLIAAEHFGQRMPELAAHVNDLAAEQPGAKPFDLIADAFDRLRQGVPTKAAGAKPKDPMQARLDDMVMQNPALMDMPMHVAFDAAGQPARTVTAREFLEQAKAEHQAEMQEASLVEVAANCFLNLGAGVG